VSLIRENEGRFQKAMAKDFKTASQEYIRQTTSQRFSAAESCSHFQQIAS
jgi:hypothetical protein